VRAFVAIDVGGAVPAPPSSTLPAPTHLTLKFLGEIAPERVEPIAGALGPAIDSIAPFEFRLSGVGAFPSAHRPRVIYVGVTDGRAELVELAGAVGAALEGVGFAPEPGEFVPHVTLFRVRSGAERERASALLEGLELEPPPRSVHVSEVQLKESILFARGAQHRTLRSFTLSGRAADG